MEHTEHDSRVQTFALNLQARQRARQLTHIHQNIQIKYAKFEFLHQYPLFFQHLLQHVLCHRSGKDWQEI